MPTVKQILLAVLPSLARKQIDIFAGPLDDAMRQFDINTSNRQAAFLAQVLHESGELMRVSENLNYRTGALLRTFPTHFNGLADALFYEKQPEKIANRVYCNRMGNGDEASGDGWRYRGRGLIQLTGKDNYAACSAGINADLVKSPDLLLQPVYASLSACWFWDSRGLSELADKSDNFAIICAKINGGNNGIVERCTIYAKLQKTIN